MAISFTALSQMLDSSNGSYIEATVAYISQVLDIEIEEFDIRDLPPAWIECIKSEAIGNNLLKKDKTEKNSLLSIFE